MINRTEKLVVLLLGIAMHSTLWAASQDNEIEVSSEVSSEVSEEALTQVSKSDAGNGKNINIIHNVIENVFVPASIQFKKAADELSKVVAVDNVLSNGELSDTVSNNVSESPVQCDSEEVKDAFRSVALAFANIEYYRLGVINQQHRAERLYFWPDRKNRGQKQVRKLLNASDRAMLNTEQLAEKSVAVQGLSALEIMLFDAKRPLQSEDCQLIRSIVSNINNIADDIAIDWQSENGIATTLRLAGIASTSNDEHSERDGAADNVGSDIYRNQQEVQAAILTLMQSALSSIEIQKVALYLQSLDKRGAMSGSAPFRYSGLTYQALRENLNSQSNLLLNSGIAEFADVEDQVNFEFTTAHYMIDASENAIEQNDVKTARNRLAAVAAIVENLQTILVGTIAPSFGVVTGFNAGDGD